MTFMSIQRSYRLPSLLRMLLISIAVTLCLAIITRAVGGQTNEDDHGDTIGTATSLLLGSSLGGRIDTADDQDVFRLDLSGEASDTDIWIYATGDVDSFGELLTSAGEVIVANDDSYIRDRQYAFHIRWPLAPGVYYISVKGSPQAFSDDMRTGDYTLNTQAIRDYPGSTLRTAASLEFDSPTPGMIDTATEAEYFRLELTDSKDLIIRATGLYMFDQDGPLPLNPVVLEALDSRGAEIPVNVDYARVGAQIQDDFGQGTYYIRVITPEQSEYFPDFESSYPVPYTIHAYEDTDYSIFIEDCAAATQALSASQTDDPLYGCQWHINNREGEDINVEAVWAEGITGRGVNVAVVDDGMDHRHEDFRENVDESRNHDYRGAGDLHHPYAHHGTNVAGIIAAGQNGVGVTGVAPGATLYGYNFLEEDTDEAMADSMARNRDVTAVSNNSWGPGDGPYLGLAPEIWKLAVDEGVRRGYDGRGVFYAFAGGNGHFGADNANLDENANYYAVTAVCAVGDDDVRSPYSETGANLWVCAPSDGAERGIVTTENSDRYSPQFGGTSAATPIVSGVAALMREANPDLTWRDLKLALAASARHNDASNLGWEDGAHKYGAQSDADRYQFNHEYGFGVVDAKAAVELARGWKTLPPFESLTVESGELNLPVPDAPATGDPTAVESTLMMTSSIDFVEFVEINVSFQHDSFRDLEIELVSPSGAVSQLVGHFDTYERFMEHVPLNGTFRFGSARHLGEDPSGEWKLRIADRVPNLAGSLPAWKLTVYGHGSTPGPPKMYWTDSTADRIQRANLDGSRVETLVTGVDAPQGIALDLGRGKMYWTVERPAKIQRANLDGSGVENLVTGLSHPVGIALDVARGKMYWADRGAGKIQRANLDGSGVQDLITMGLGWPYGLALDVGRGKMYWSSDITEKIQRANLDGTGVGDLVTGLNSPVALALDPVGGKVYWADRVDNERAKIQRANLDGSRVQDLITTGVEAPYGLALDLPGGKIYWTDIRTSKIQRANLDGSGVEDLITSGVTLPNGIALDLDCSHTLSADESVSDVWFAGCDSLTRAGNYAHYYTFTLARQSQVTITLESPVDTLLRLREGTALDGEVLHENDDAPGLGTNSEIGVNLSAGTYTIEATTFGSGETGSFTLTISLETATPPSRDRDVLIALYNATDGGNWKNNTNWLSDRPIGEWDGVTTDAGGRVTELELIDNQLSGPIPADLGSLTYLERLVLGSSYQCSVDGDCRVASPSANRLSGQIPSSLGNLSNLQELWLFANQLSGQIPSSLGSLSNLEGLDLSGNQLTGTIPTQLGNLSNLGGLDLSGNQLTGTIPTQLGNLSNLGGLDLSGNQLSGQIPSELGSLSDLQGLHLWGNQLSGQIPSELGRLSNLQGLHLWGNQLSGQIPSELGNLSDLHRLDLWGNQLSGQIPSELGNLSNLEGLDLGGNQLSGQIPSSLGSLPELQELYLSGNQLSGQIPSELGRLSNLQGLHLWGNQLSGQIPSELGSLSDLHRLDLWGNQLSGQIPSELGNLSNLEGLDLGGNQLSGQIPSSLGSLSELQELYLSGNQSSGQIPSELGSLSDLHRLDLWGNQLSGQIPSELGNLSNLEGLNLGGNQLTGTIPTQLGSLSDLQELYLSGNQLTGQIPPELGSLANLGYLYLSSNRLTGSLPANFTQLTALEQFAFGDNAGLCAPTDTAFQNWLAAIPNIDLPQGVTPLGPNCGAATLPETIIFGDLNWSSALVQNRIAQYIAEMGYGYSTSIVPGSTRPLFQALRAGDIDVLMEIWLPNQEEDWEEALAEGAVSSPGRSLGTDWQSAFVIPKYLQEQHPSLDSVEDLKEEQYRSLFATDETDGKARLVSCVIGWACEDVNSKQIDGYSLSDHVHIVNPGSLEALNADLTEAYENEEPWLGYQWGTNEPALLLDLVRLEEPAYSDECWEATGACAYEDATILIAVNAGLSDSASDFVDVLTEWDFNVDGVYKHVVRWQTDNPGANTEYAALWWLRANSDVWSEWVTADARVAIQDALDSGEIPDGWPEAPSITPEPPSGAPTITALTPGADFLTVTWAAPAGSGGPSVRAYDLRHIRTSDDETVDANWTVVDDAWTAGSGALSYRISGLIDGTRYDVQVRAVTGAGAGPWSATATAAPGTVGTGATRSFSAPAVAPGGQLVVTIEANNYGTFGGVVETLPGGFSYVSSSLPSAAVDVTGQQVSFRLFGESSFTYTVTASNTVGDYVFEGVLRDADRVDYAIGGDSVITVGDAPGVSAAPTTSGATLQVRINSPIPVTTTFSEPVTGFAVGDVTVANGTATDFVGSDGDSVYTFDVTPNAIGAVTVDIAAGVALDAENNGNTAAVQLSLGIPYDDDHDGKINRGEVITAIGDYLFGGNLTRDQVIAIISLYLFG